MRILDNQNLTFGEDTEKILVWTRRAAVLTIEENEGETIVRLNENGEGELTAFEMKPDYVVIEVGGERHVLRDLLLDAQRAKDLEATLDSIAAMHGTG